jgi:hypothetical protein
MNRSKTTVVEQYRDRVKLYIPLFVVLEIVDGILTYALVGKEMVREANPLLYDTAGSCSFLIMKILGAFLSAILIWLLYQRLPKLGLITSFVIMMFYASICTWNIHIFFQII